MPSRRGEVADHTLFELADQIGRAGWDHARWPQALEHIGNAFRCTVARIFSHDEVTGIGKFEFLVDSENDSSSADNFWKPDGWPRGDEVHGAPGTVLKDDVSSEELVVGLFDEFLRTQDIGHKTVGVIDRYGSEVVYLLLGRSNGDTRFGQKERSALRRLLPFLRDAVGVHRLVDGEQLTNLAVLEPLNGLPVGVCVLGADGVVLSSNRAAREIFSAGDGLSLGSDGAVVAHNHFRAKLLDLVNGATRPTEVKGDAARGHLTIPRPSGGRPLHILVSPFLPRRSLLGDRHPVATMVVVDPDRGYEVDEDRVGRFYGLTAAEARLTTFLARGRRLDEAAEDLGITYETARTHLKRIFNKTGAERQTELVRLVLCGPVFV